MGNVFLGIPMEYYSLFFAAGTILLFVITILWILAYIFCWKIREKSQNISYFTLIGVMGFFALLATLGALGYQFGYGLFVCEMCWWQRIFMFPIEAVVLVTLIHKIRKNHQIIAILAGIGALFSAYHYTAHLQKYVLASKSILSMGCDISAGAESCTTAPFMTFGFVSIPLMALVVFVFVLWLCFLAGRTKK